MMRKVFIGMLFFCLAHQGFSQKYGLDITFSENIKITYKKSFSDSLSLLKELGGVISMLRAEGFLAANVDTLTFNSEKTGKVYLNVGAKYEWVYLKKGNVLDVLLEKVSFKERFYANRTFKVKELLVLENRIIKISENNGFPFAQIALDSLIFIDDNAIGATFNYTAGPLIKFDSIQIVGDVRIKPKFLSNYLNLKRGDIFSQAAIDDAEIILNKLPYLSQEKPPNVIFIKGKAYLRLYLTHKKASVLNGIVGFLPNEGADKKLLVTGEVNLALQNLFSSGKAFTANWRKFDASSQVLDLSYYHPDFLRSNIDITPSIDLLKEDTTFITVNRSIDFSYNVASYGKLGVYSRLKTSRILSTSQYDTINLPASLDINYLSYGLKYNFVTLDNVFFPRRGWEIEIDLGVGNKIIRKNSSIAEKAYQNRERKSLQLVSMLEAKKYSKLGKQTVLLTSFKGGIIQNKNKLKNDLFRIGGLTTLRGFNQNNFFTSSYGIFTTEMRLYSDETTYFLGFLDHAIMNADITSGLERVNATAFGAGVSFATQTGVFSFIYSLGSTSFQKFDFSLSKIHFGLVSNF